MREIKFRAWDPRLNRMFYSESHEDARYLGARVSDSVFEVFVHHFLSLFIVNDGRLMQYTGLKDKNGKDIYEGDILGGMWGDGWIGYCDKCKSFEYFGAGFGCMGCEGDVCWYEIVNAESEGQLEVIGNIYENPELLES